MELIEKKKCSTCLHGYPANSDFFNNSKNGKKNSRGEGLKSECRTCQSNYRKQYYQKNKNKEKERGLKDYYDNKSERSLSHQKWKDENQDKIRERSKKYYYGHQEELKKKSLDWATRNKDRKAETLKEWKRNHRSEIRNYEKQKWDNDPNFKMARVLRNRMRHAVKSQGCAKKGHLRDMIGCSISFFKQHIESQFQDGMTWENYGRRGWHIDHIRPCSSFNLTSEKDQKECFHYSNTQPLWEKDNLSKSSYYKGKLIRRYNKLKWEKK